MKQEEIEQGRYPIGLRSYVTIKRGDRRVARRWEVIYIDPLGNYYLTNDKQQLVIMRLENLIFDGHPPKMWEDVYVPYSDKPILVRDLFY